MTTLGPYQSIIESYIERWILAKPGLRIEILRDDDSLEWVETTDRGCTTGNGGYAEEVTMPGAVLDIIRTHIADGYHLAAHEQYDPAQLAAYLDQHVPAQLELFRSAA